MPYQAVIIIAVVIAVTLLASMAAVFKAIIMCSGGVQ